jgi:DNA repair ATPase RecN
MSALIAGMFLFDYYSTQAVRYPIASQAKQRSYVNQDSVLRAAQATENARLSAVPDAIRENQVSIRQLERQMQQVRQEVAANNPSLTRLINQGNGWAKTQLSATQAKAAKPIQDQIKQLQSLGGELRSQRAKDLQRSGDNLNAVAQRVSEQNQAIQKYNVSMVEGTSSLFLWLGFYCKVIAGLIRVLLTVMFLANAKDVNGDGKINYLDVSPAAQSGFLGG